MLCFKSILLFSSLVYQAQTGGVFSFIKPCKADDKACITKSTQDAVKPFTAGVPEHGLPVGDPLDMKTIDISNNGLKLLIKNSVAIGASKCTNTVAERDVKRNVIIISTECPVKVIGQYEASGKILFLEVVGNGDIEIKSDRVQFIVTAKLKTIDGPDGKKHWKISGFDYKYDFKEKVVINLTNLFNGDKTRAEPFLELLNNSWKELVPDIGEPIIKHVITTIFANVNKMFLMMPIEELEIAS